MKLVHFSSKKLRAITNAKQEPRLDYYAKPNGLWVSDEDDYGWREWCKDNSFRTQTMRYAYEIELDPKANILFIRTPAELERFTKEYEGPKLLPDSIMVANINWPIVAKKYQGIVITPYLWSKRMDHDAFWYYGWDCASGCIWDARAIKSFKEVSYGKKAVPVHAVQGKRRSSHTTATAKDVA